MSMSAVCLALASLEKQPQWLRIIEYIFFGMNVLTFVLNLTSPSFVYRDDLGLSRALSCQC